MNKALKWGLIVCASLAVVIIAALLIIPMFVDIQKYKPVLEKKVAEASGRPFSVGDDLRLSLFPWAGVSLTDLRLGNLKQFEEKDFVSVKSFEVRIKLLPLLSKNIQVKKFILNEPRIVLVKNKDGRTNWTQPEKSDSPKVEKPKDEPGTSSGGISDLPIKSLAVGDFSIKNGSILYVDHAAEARNEIKDMNLTMQDMSLNRPIVLAFSARLDEKPISLDGTVGPVGTGFSQGAIPLDLILKALTQIEMRLKGNLQNPAADPTVDLTIDLKEFSPRKLLAALDQPFPVNTADPKVLDRVSFRAQVKAGAQSASVTDGALALDESKMNFSFKAGDFSRPNVAFDIMLDQIDVDRYLPPKAEKQTTETQPDQAAAQPASKKTKTDYTPLRRLILDGRLKIGNAIVNKAKLQDIDLKITAKNGIINLDPLKLNLYQGKASVKATLNVTKDVPKSDINLLVDKVQAGPLLQDVLDKDILEGATQANVTLAMMGADAVSIKKTLSGKGELLFNDGAIKGIDLAGMIRNVQAAFGLAEKPKEKPRTDFAELKAPFSITDGVVSTPQTSLISPLLRVIAAGDADLVQETLDFRVEPKVVGTIKGQGDEKQRSGIIVPVLVTGNFSSPKFRPDLKSATTQQLKEKVLESEKVKKVLEKEKLKPLEEKTKGVLKGILGQ